MRILFICSEYEGLIKTGGLADACRGLAQALLAQGHQVTVQSGAGVSASIPDSAYAAVGAVIGNDAAAFGADLAAMRHETMDVRIFRT